MLHIDPNDSAYTQSLCIITDTLNNDDEIRQLWLDNLTKIIEDRANTIYTDPYIKAVNKLLAEQSAKDILSKLWGVN